MKKTGLIIVALALAVSSNAQENLNQLLAAGVADAERFSASYIKPANDGLAYGINTGWFNNAKTPKRFGFELYIIGNATFISDEDKQFVLDVSEYENIRFPDNSPNKGVATALGHNDPAQTVIITYDDPIFGNQEREFELPTGIGSQNINLIPTAFLQASFSPFEGTQLKARYFPKIDQEDTKLGLYGFGLQQDFTAFLSEDNLLPITISGLIAYTHLDGRYDFTDEGVVEGENAPSTSAAESVASKSFQNSASASSSATCVAVASSTCVTSIFALSTAAATAADSFTTAAVKASDIAAISFRDDATLQRQNLAHVSENALAFAVAAADASVSAFCCALAALFATDITQM